jgi:prepilin-type N-terminal cleavage/methylation domain-containing protein
MKRKEFKKGFTLIELSFVMTILSILAPLLIQYFAFTAKYSTIDAFKEDIAGVIRLQENIKEEKGTYAYFDYISTENDSVLKIYNEYSFLVKMKETSIRVSEGVRDDCYILTAVKDNMKASFDSCYESRKHFIIN